MDRLITDISNASRVDAELARQGREVVDVNQLVKDIVSVYGDLGKFKVPVSYQGSSGPAILLGSPSALGQVISNLIDNALSFSPADGSVRVFVHSLLPNAPLLRITVEDDGPGIPPDNLESIFKRFYTKRPAGTAFGNNSGLGLAISQQIVVSHNGRIYAQNRLSDPADPNSAQRRALCG